ISIVHGRFFDEHDRQDGVPVALVNQTMARKLWPKGDSIGGQIRVNDNNTGPRPLEIVGVVGDVKQLNLESDPAFDIYIPMAQFHEDNVGAITNSHYWVVRSSLDSSA